MDGGACCQERLWVTNEDCVSREAKPVLKTVDAGFAGALGARHTSLDPCVPLICASQRLTGRKVRSQTRVSRKFDGFHLPRALVNFLIFSSMSFCAFSARKM